MVPALRAVAVSTQTAFNDQDEHIIALYARIDELEAKLLQEQDTARQEADQARQHVARIEARTRDELTKAQRRAEEQASELQTAHDRALQSAKQEAEDAIALAHKTHETQVKLSQQQINALKVDAAKHKITVANLEQQLAQSQEDIEDQKAQKILLRNDLELASSQLRQQDQAQKEAAKGHTNTQAKLADEAKAMREQVEQARQAETLLNKQLKDSANSYKERLKHLSDKLEERKSAFRLLSAEHEQLQLDHADVQGTLGVFDQKMQDLAQQLTEEKIQCNRLELRASALEQTEQRQRAECEALRKNINEKQAEAIASTERFEAQLQDQQALVAQLTTELASRPAASRGDARESADAKGVEAAEATADKQADEAARMLGLAHLPRTSGRVGVKKAHPRPSVLAKMFGRHHVPGGAESPSGRLGASSPVSRSSFLRVSGSGKGHGQEPSRQSRTSLSSFTRGSFRNSFRQSSFQRSTPPRGTQNVISRLSFASNLRHKVQSVDPAPDEDEPFAVRQTREDKAQRAAADKAPPMLGVLSPVISGRDWTGVASNETSSSASTRPLPSPTAASTIGQPSPTTAATRNAAPPTATRQCSPSLIRDATPSPSMAVEAARAPATAPGAAPPAAAVKAATALTAVEESKDNDADAAGVAAAAVKAIFAAAVAAPAGQAASSDPGEHYPISGAGNEQQMPPLDANQSLTLKALTNFEAKDPHGILSQSPQTFVSELTSSHTSSSKRTGSSEEKRPSGAAAALAAPADTQAHLGEFVPASFDFFRDSPEYPVRSIDTGPAARRHGDERQASGADSFLLRRNQDQPGQALQPLNYQSEDANGSASSPLRSSMRLPSYPTWAVMEAAAECTAAHESARSFQAPLDAQPDQPGSSPSHGFIRLMRRFQRRGP